METFKMIPAKIKISGLKVFVHEGRIPNSPMNKGKVVVSKQPNSNSIFSVSPEGLEFLAE